MSGAVAALRDAAWLTGVRARAYAMILAFVLAGAAAVVIVSRYQATANDPAGRPPATDFIPFYAAGHLAAVGRPQDAYRLAALMPEERARVTMPKGSLPFMYPPPLLLLCQAVSYLPLGWAWLAFEAAGLVPFLFFVRRLLPPGWTLLPVAVAPAVWMTLGSGQTGFLTAASFAGAAALLETRPKLAGACLGALVCKPHFALMVPLALFAARRLGAAVACAATAAALCAASLAIYGPATWQAFFAQSPLARDVLENWPQDWRILLSAYGGVRVLGGGIALAYAAQLAAAGVAAWLLIAGSLRRPDGAAQIALLCAAAFVATPYVMDYDLVSLAVPALWLASASAATSWRGWEKIVLFLLYLLPLVARAAVLGLGVPLAQPVLAAFFALVCRRALRRVPA
jgi:hypothetical protein